MVKRLLAGLAIALAACEDASNPTATRSVQIRLRPAPDLATTTWERTDSVRLRATSTQKVQMLDTTIAFGTGTAPGFSCPADQGITVEASGWTLAGERLWTASVVLPGAPATSDTDSDILLSMLASPPPRVQRDGFAMSPTVVVVPGSGWDTLRLGSSTPMTTIHYTLDGSSPQLGSPTYATPIPVRLPVHLRAIALGDTVFPSAILDTILSGAEGSRP